MDCTRLMRLARLSRVSAKRQRMAPMRSLAVAYGGSKMYGFFSGIHTGTVLARLMWLGPRRRIRFLLIVLDRNGTPAPREGFRKQDK